MGWRLYIRFFKSVANLHIPGPLVRTEQSVPGTNPVDHRSEESDAGPSGSQGFPRSAAQLLKVAEDALQAAREARVAAESAFRSPSMKRARETSPDDDIIFVGASKHYRVINP